MNLWSLHFLEAERDISTVVKFEYNWTLVLLSVLVAIAAAYVSFLASERLQTRKNAENTRLWTLAGAIALGSGIWSMHFIGMLAVDFHKPISYDIALTALSGLPAIIASGIAIYPTRFKFAIFNTLLVRAVILGAGIGIMHYSGMMAMRMENMVMRYNIELFLFSIVVAVVLAYLALWMRQRAELHLENHTDTRRTRLVASIIMGSAITGMHYTGMASVLYFNEPNSAVVINTWDPAYLTLIILLVMCAIIVILVTAVYFSRNRDLLNKLQVNEDYLKTLFNTVPSGIFTVDKDCIIRTVNPMAESIFGRPLDTMVGLSLNKLMSVNLNRKSNCAHVLDQFDHESKDLDAIRSDGSTFPISVSSSVIHHAEENLYVVVVNDITSRKEYEQTLTEARDEAETANQAKSAFLAAMSHEIRTPMNGVIGLVDVLRQGTMDESQKSTLLTIQESSFALLRIIDDILDFSKIEAGKMELEMVSTCVESIVESVRESLCPIAESKGLELILLVDPDVPPAIKSDPVRIRQILFNLVGNAIKFTSDNSERQATVIIAIDMHANNKSNLRIRIIDNGIGISETVQKTLFRSFSQAERSTTRRFGGTGLGLVISERLVSMMNGKISVESEVGHGTIFTVSIPVEAEETALTQFDTNLDEITALLITKRTDDFLIMANQLSDKGAEVTCLEPNKAEKYFLNNALPHDRTVAIFDGANSYKNNIQQITLLREKFSDLNIRFVILENERQGTPRIENGDSIVLDLNKLTRYSFVRAVAAVVGRSSIEPQVVTEDEIPALKNLIQDESRQNHKILIAEDNKTNRNVINKQLELLGYQADMAEDGLIALNMWKENNYELILTDCHMPEMDGYTLSKEIRLLETDYHVPIVAITADALKGTREECLAAGMDDYLTKPIQLRQLAPVLDKWLVKNNPNLEIQADTPESTTSAVVVDEDFLKDIIGVTDNDVLAEIYHDFLKSSMVDTKNILVEKNNKQSMAISKLAHKLKSSSRTIGANILADCCERLESAGKVADWDIINTDVSLLEQHFLDVKQWVSIHHDSADIEYDLS